MADLRRRIPAGTAPRFAPCHPQHPHRQRPGQRQQHPDLQPQDLADPAAGRALQGTDPRTAGPQPADHRCRGDGAARRLHAGAARHQEGPQHGASGEIAGRKARRPLCALPAGQAVRHPDAVRRGTALLSPRPRTGAAPHRLVPRPGGADDRVPAPRRSSGRGHDLCLGRDALLGAVGRLLLRGGLPAAGPDAEAPGTG